MTCIGHMTGHFPAYEDLDFTSKHERRPSEHQHGISSIYIKEDKQANDGIHSIVISQSTTDRFQAAYDDDVYILRLIGKKLAHSGASLRIIHLKYLVILEKFRFPSHRLWSGRNELIAIHANVR